MIIDINKRKQEFKNIMLYGFKDLECVEEVLLGCLGKGYRDMTTARSTFQGIGDIFKEREDNLKKERKQSKSKETESYRESFYKELVKIVKDNLLSNIFIEKEIFDKAHNSCCEEIIELFYNEFSEDFYKKNGEKFIYYYGSAQKLINMTLKYFLLAAEDYKKDTDINNISEYENIKANERFLHCPIDSIVIEVLNKERKQKGVKEKITLTWSKMSESDYKNLQQEIESYIGDQSKLNYDFEVWNRKALIDK